MSVPSSIADISTTAASNSPSGSEAIGTSLDDYMRSIQAIIKQESSRGSDITAASSITIPNAGRYFVVTGNTGISTIVDSWQGRTVAIKFSGTPVLTHSSGLILPTGANITAAAGDVAIVSNESTGVWRVIAYMRASGAALYGLAASDIGVSVQAYDAQLSSLIRQNSQSADYTCVLTDSGKHILHPSADTSARTFTIPANGSVAYPIGTALTFVNQASAGSITIAITSDTMRLAGAGSTGSRTLAANGIATAIKITSTEWIISGTGLA